MQTAYDTKIQSYFTFPSRPPQTEREKSVPIPLISEATVVNGIPWSELRWKLLNPKFDKAAFMDTLSQSDQQLFLQLSKAQKEQGDYSPLQGTLNSNFFQTRLKAADNTEIHTGYRELMKRKEEVKVKKISLI